MSSTPSRGSRIARILTRLVAGLAALILVTYLGVNAVAYFSSRGKIADARSQTTAAIADARPATEAHQAQVSASLGDPDQAWIEQECVQGSRDRGWTVYTYTSTCTLRSVEAYAVADVRDATSRLARGDQDVVGAAPDPADVGDCVLLGLVRSGESYRAGSIEVQSRFVPAEKAVPASSANPWCGKYFPGSSLPENRQLISGSSNSLDPNRAWLVVRRGAYLGEHQVGCMRWSVIFCDTPPGVPVFGEVFAT
ncbi:MAG: hypothetical protein LKG20_06280 [Tetrasphaera jenkinsii]|jgi:hypothetical protein|nr:hypothetical protein [Tetrasphaera jenkinsii]